MWIHRTYKLISYMNLFVRGSLTGTLFSCFCLGKYYLCMICDQLYCNVALVWCILQAQHQCVTCPMGRQMLVHRETSWAGQQVGMWSIHWKSENSDSILHEPERCHGVEFFGNKKAGPIGWAPGKIDTIWTLSVCFVKQFTDGGVSTSHKNHGDSNAGEKWKECMWIHHFVILHK